MHHLFLSEVPTELQQYGVFAALVAVAAMIVVAVGGIARLWRGPLAGWEVPGQPPFLNRIVTLPSGFFLVFGFLYATPETLWSVLIVGGILAFISTTVGGIYATMTMKYRRVKKVIVGDYQTKDVSVLAGDQLTDWAQRTMLDKNLTDQQLFAGTPHEPYSTDHVWVPESRVRVFGKMTVLFVIALFCGTGALSWLAYGVEVKVTGKPAYAVLSPSQIPTGNPDATQKSMGGH